MSNECIESEWKRPKMMQNDDDNNDKFEIDSRYKWTELRLLTEWMNEWMSKKK